MCIRDRSIEDKDDQEDNEKNGTGRGGADGGTSRKVGHKYLFGNTEDQCRIDNLGCAPRGRPTDGPFNHKTGKGYVKGKKGAYHDALFVKRNRVDLLLHEDLGGGFSPPAAHKIRRLGRKSREHGVDRTPYQGDRKISFVSYHTRAISMNIVRATAWTLYGRCTTPRKKLRAASAANAPAAPPRSADLVQPSVAPESKRRARGYPVQFKV